MKIAIMGGQRKFAFALAASAVALAATPAVAGQKLTDVAPGQTRYLIEYNAGNKQAVKNAIAQYGGRVVLDYSALFNGLAADLDDRGAKSIRTSSLIRTIEADVIRDLHDPVRRQRDFGDDSFMARRAANIEAAGASQQAAPSTSRDASAALTQSSPIRATSAVQSGSKTEGGAAFNDGGINAPSPDALPAGFPDGVFSEFVPWGRDRVNADVVWSVGPNFGVADNGVAAPNVAPGSITGAGVVVAVLDTGIDYDHPDLVDNIINDCGTDGVIRDFLAIPEGLDDCAEDSTFNGHGTSVASVIASVDNAVGLIGVAPEAMIRPYRVCDGGCPLSAIIGGLVQATVDGVDVINMSFGGGAGKNFEASAIQAAAQAGVVLVASAGNDSSQKIHFPAGYGQVLAVGATDINDNPASFTNTGGWVDITGPGVNNPTATCTGCVTEGFVDELSPTMQSFAANEITGSPIAIVTNAEVVNVGRGCVSTLGDTHASDPSGKVALIVRGACSFAEKVLGAEAAGAIGTIVYNNAPGNFNGTLGTGVSSNGPAISLSQADGQTLAAEIASATTTADVGIRRRNDIEYWFISGTSFSGPHVAGVAALVKSANPSLSADEIRNLIVNTAEDFGNQNIFGAGMVRADNAVNAALP